MRRGGSAEKKTKASGNEREVCLRLLGDEHVREGKGRDEGREDKNEGAAVGMAQACKVKVGVERRKTSLKDIGRHKEDFL